jgi:hypothetical protein
MKKLMENDTAEEKMKIQKCKNNNRKGKKKICK